ncbi:MAG: transketolase C-terminal domain-containing protein [Gemmatimonadaceae bacterium]
MRTAFIKALTACAQADPRITLVTGDLGFGVVTDFARDLPGQYVNAGVAEQNMTGLAAGLAHSGRIVVTYSIANFPTLRALEQIRNDICAPRANVKVVSVGGGFAYGPLGASHHATEDLAVMRALPGMTVIAPNDPEEARQVTAAALALDGPCYLRLGRAGEPAVHQGPVALTLGRALVARQGSDLTLVATGGMLHTAMHVATRLRDIGLSARVLSMHTVRPLDREALLAAARDTSALFTIEEHSVIGGLGSATAEVLLEADERPAVFMRFGIRESDDAAIGSQEFLRARAGLDVDSITNGVVECLERVRHARRQVSRARARGRVRSSGAAAER